MSKYKLMFGGSELGDELVFPLSHWEGRITKTSLNEGLEHIVSLDNQPIAVRLYPQFRIRKKAADFREFERWVFELVNWADGVLRKLWIVNADSSIVSVDYGYSKFIGLERPLANGIYSSSWSDNIIVKFQSEQQPEFPNWD